MSGDDRVDGCPAELTTTRHALHCVAEHVLAAALHEATGRIGLRATPGGFGTPPFVRGGAECQIRVDGTGLVVAEAGSERRHRLTTIADAADHVGVVPGGPGAVYPLVTALEPDASLAIDEVAASIIHRWFAVTSAALEQFRRDHADRGPSIAQLWPEHFDLAITMDEVNYGGSPGDAGHDAPYAYVGPWDRDRVSGGFWNEPFGASRSLADVPSVASMVAFFESGRTLAAR